MERNKEREKREGQPAPNSAIQLPFIIVNTSKKTVIDCSISNDKMEYLFNFDNTFEIHDDMEVSSEAIFFFVKLILNPFYVILLRFDIKKLSCIHDMSKVFPALLKLPSIQF